MTVQEVKNLQFVYGKTNCRADDETAEDSKILYEEEDYTVRKLKPPFLSSQTVIWLSSSSWVFGNSSVSDLYLRYYFIFFLICFKIIFIFKLNINMWYYVTSKKTNFNGEQRRLEVNSSIFTLFTPIIFTFLAGAGNWSTYRYLERS